MLFFLVVYRDNFRRCWLAAAQELVGFCIGSIEKRMSTSVDEGNNIVYEVSNSCSSVLKRVVTKYESGVFFLHI